MKSVMFLLLFVVCLSAVSAQLEHVFVIDMVSEDGSLLINSIRVEPRALPTIKDDFGPYRVEVQSLDGALLNTHKFLLEHSMTIESFDETTGEALAGLQVELERVAFTLEMPYYPAAAKLTFYDENDKVLLKEDVSRFSTEEVGEVAEEIVPEIVPEIAEKKPKGLQFSMVAFFIILLAFLLWEIRQFRKR